MKELTYGSVCSGIEAVSVAWSGLNLKPIWFSEIEPFPCAVLAHHYPTIPNHGDMTTLPERILSGEIEAPDILVGGTPCQAFSVAGLRNSLNDERGNLTLVFVRILNAINTIRRRHGLPDAVVLWENVPGVLSTRDNAFGCFLAALSGESKELVPTGGRWTGAGIVRSDECEIAWRILDAQYFGVPQRRRRVFLVAGTGRARAAQILFERKGLRGNIESSKKAREDVAAAVREGSHWDDERLAHPTLTQSSNTGGIGMSNQEIFSQRGGGLVMARMRGFGDYIESSEASTVKERDYKDATDLVIQTKCCGNEACVGAVRRLMPLECERLQGLPDNYTRIPWRGKPAEECPDGHRYKAIGNSMAVPVMRWIGERMCRI